MSVYRLPNDSGNSKECTYMHCYGFQPQNPYILERNCVKSYATAISFGLMSMFFVQLSLQFLLSYWIRLNYGILVPKSISGIVFQHLESIAQTGIYILSIVIPCFLIRSGTRIPLKVALPVRKPQKGMLLFGIMLGLGGTTLGMFTAYAVQVLLALLGYEVLAPYSQPPTSGLEFVLYAVETIVVAGILEELLFRGVIMQSLRRFGDSFAILVSAILFGVVHGNPVQSVNAFFVGLFMGFLVVITGNIWASISVHMLHNGFNVIMLQIEPLLEPDTFAIVMWGCYALFLLCAVVGITNLAKRNSSIFDLNNSNGVYNFSTHINIFFSAPAMIITLILIFLLTIQSIQRVW